MPGAFGAEQFSPELQCSRAGCHEAPAWNINWRNPALHGAERVKVWLSCDAHRAFFLGYFQSRDFPVSVTGFGVAVTTVESGPTS